MNHGATDSIQIEGYDLVMRSLEVGHTFAMNAMAQLYLDDEGEYFDAARGLRYLNESAARGDIYGINALALAWWRGRAGWNRTMPRPSPCSPRPPRPAIRQRPTIWRGCTAMARAPGGVDLEQAVALFVTALDRGHATSAAQAAFLIRSEEVPGFDTYDAAALAARGAVLLNAGGAADAEEQLVAMGEADLIGGAQRLLAQMGADLPVTGTMDAATEAALQALAPDAAGLTDAAQRIRAVATAYWAATPFRVDLY